MRLDLTRLTILPPLVVEVATNSVTNALPEGARGTITRRMRRIS